MTVAKIISKEQVKQCALTKLIPSNTASIIGVKQLFANQKIVSFSFMESCPVEVHESSMGIQCPFVGMIYFLK